jgi:hypothetical protein
MQYQDLIDRLKCKLSCYAHRFCISDRPRRRTWLDGMVAAVIESIVARGYPACSAMDRRMGKPQTIVAPIAGVYDELATAIGQAVKILDDAVARVYEWRDDP